MTDRLELRAVDPVRDLQALFAIFSDPASWEHAPDSRHLEPDTTLGWLQRAATRWQEDTLSYWTARLRTNGEVVGVGGARRHVTGSWNLLWRIDTAHQGQGLARELGTVAIEAARAVDSSVPVIAWVRSHNVASRGLASRLGLIEHSERVDECDGVARIPYADRPI